MLATSVRVRPWSCLWCFASLGRVTVRVEPSMVTVISGWSARLSDPFGPFTVIFRPTIDTSTLGGTSIGRRPIRDIVRLPDVSQDFTTELGLVGLSSGH